MLFLRLRLVESFDRRA